MGEVNAHHLRAGEPAPYLVLFDVRGESIALSSLWPERPLLLTFLRHFG
jgi:hypothetical protein